MSRTVWLLVIGVAAYLTLTFMVGGGVLWLTWWTYTSGGETRAATVSAAVLNTTAATLLWLAFIGGLDMFFTIWQMMQNREDAARRDREREEERKERAARDKAQEEERKAREEAQEAQRQAQEADRKAREEARAAERQARAQELAEQRQFQQAVLQRLDAEREENRREREAYRREQEEDRQQREQFFATLLQAEKERSDMLMSRFLDVIERMDKRGNNGNGTRNAD